MYLAARYRAITYREYEDIAPTGVLTQSPRPCQILYLNPENPTTPWMGKCLHIFVSPVHKMVYLAIALCWHKFGPIAGGGRSYGRLGLLFISATKKVRKNPKK